MAWVTAGNDVYITSGNVGIGTSSISRLLHVQGSSGTPLLRIGTSTRGIEVKPDGDTVRFDGQGGSPATNLIVLNTQTGNVRLNDPPNTADFEFDRINRKVKIRSILMEEAGDKCELALRRHGGTYPDGTRVALSANEAPGIIYWQPYGSNGDFDAGSGQPGRIAYIEAQCDNAPSGTDRSGRMIFATTPGGSINPSIRLQIEPDGLLLIPTTANESRAIKFLDNAGSSIVEHMSGGGIGFSTDNSDLSPGQSVRMIIPAANFSAGSAVYVDSDGKTLTTTAPSSGRYKENISDCAPDISRLYDLQLKSFTWKTTGEADYGFIAEDVKAVLPTLIGEGEDVARWRADRFQFLLFQGLKQLKARVETLQKRRVTGAKPSNGQEAGP